MASSLCNAPALGFLLPVLLAGAGAGPLRAENHEPRRAEPASPQLLLEVRRAAQGEAAAASPPAGIIPPPAATLQTLRVTLEELDLEGTGSLPVLSMELITGGSGGFFPPGMRLELHLVFGSLPEEGPAVAHHVLSATLEEPGEGTQRRRRAAGGFPAVLRFAGLQGLGDLGSMEPGRSVTFRMPLSRLLDGASASQRQAARQTGGTWRLALWAESRLGAAGDRLPPAGGAVLEVAEPPSP